MAKHKLKKPVLGIDQLSDETDLISDEEKKITAIREGTNVDIDVDGNVSRRNGYTLKLSGPGYHSLYESSRGWLMCCNKQELGVYTPETNTFAVITNMAENYLTSFTELNGNLYFMNPGHKGMIRVDETFARPLGETLPDVTPSFTAVADGGLSAGNYGITYSVVNNIGEESPLGPLTVVSLSESSAIQGSLFTVAAGYKYRIYMTATDGVELYQVAEFDADVTDFLVSSFADGRRPATQYLSNLPFGYIIRAHGSRLYVATDDFVFFSRPFLPHLTNAAHDFLPTTGFTSMLQPVDGGIFIGDQTGVKFYNGDDPEEFIPKDVSKEVPVFGTAVAVPGEYLPEEFASADVSAVWLTQSGFYIGLPSGEAVRLHSKQVALPRYVQGCTTFAVQDGRKQVITPVNSNVLASASVALDSTYN
jgi:hypothetical protein